MLSRPIVVCILVVLSTSCERGRNSSKTTVRESYKLDSDWTELISKQVIVEGIAGNAKEGAFVDTENGKIWMDDFNWPEVVYSHENKDTRVRVKGTLLRRDDMPVYLLDPSDPSIRAGIPVDSEEELEREKWRFWLKHVSWNVVEEDTNHLDQDLSTSPDTTLPTDH